MSALTGSPGKPQWATVARLSKAVDSQSRVNVARVASDGSESASPLNFGSSSPTASSRLPAVTSIPRHVVLSHNRGASPKAIGDMLASVADTESRRIRAVEETVVRTSAVASVAEGSASVLARLQLNAALLESPDEEQDDAAAADRKRVLLEQFSTDALTSSVARLRVTDPSERMAYIQPVQQLVFKEAGMTKE